MEQLAAKILILEDDPSWQEIYAEIVSELGFNYCIANSAREALFKLLRSFYHLVIVDLSLAKDDPRNLDGMKVLKWIRQLNEGTQAVVATAYTFPKSIRDVFKEGGAFDLIDKGADNRKDIELAIRNGITATQQHMNIQFTAPSSYVQNLDIEPLEQTLGMRRSQFEWLLDTTPYLVNDLFKNTTNIAPNSSALMHSLEFLSRSRPLLLPHKQQARLVPKENPYIIVAQFWDRLLERCLRVRISSNQQIQREYELFSAQPHAMQIMGMKKVSMPFFTENHGSIVYVMDETEDLFTEFEHPWLHLLNSI